MTLAFLGIGSNLGSREMMLDRACREISRNLGRVVRASHVYETEPVGFVSEHRFMNACLVVETKLSALALLKTILHIEADLGRGRRSSDYSDRCIDLDILMFGSEIITEAEIVVPHPRLHLRRFVLEPMAEIAGEVFHPVMNKSIKELLDICNDNNKVTILDRVINFRDL